MPQPQVLWLGDNQISCISGLAQLTALQELNLARNQIEVVGNALDVNGGLHTLNLADNRIGSFKQVNRLHCSAAQTLSAHLQGKAQELRL